VRVLVLAVALAAPTAFAQDHSAVKGGTAKGETKAEAGHGSSEHGGGHEQPSMVWKWVNFGILAGLIGYGIAKGAGPFFRARTEQIQKALVEAKMIREDAERRASEIDRRMANLGADIESLRTESRKEMAAESDRLKAETERIVAKIEAHAHQEIQSAAKLAAKDLRRHAAELALQLAERKIQARMTPKTQERLVDDFVSQLRAPASDN
jgi:F-type H+-transporting ATPase subunit b